ncbi:signal peptidase I [Halorubellus sp. PRR65]|uniref:signal peptidase I n=1 Tax=Halorubellus sp. PRR65 TaxID=3098148 RepID=UPI002B261136|nr:signal peptidase I [Halorubellus sp. PRR65]
MPSVTGRLSTAVVVVAVILLVASSVGQPLLLSYVRSGSMAPTLDSGDGFVAVPTAIAGPPEEGDVIIYRAQELNGGGLTTHRVVRENDHGYVTQGDANPFTDQSAGEPPVRRQQVVAIGLEVGGSVLAIPALGTGVTAVRESTSDLIGRLGFSSLDGSRLWLGAAAAGVVLLLFGGRGNARGRRPENRDRDLDRRVLLSVRNVALLAAAVVVVAATASMVLPLGPVQYDVVSAESDLPGPRVIPAGESETTTYRVPGGRLFPTRYYVEPGSDAVAVGTASGVVRPGENENVSVTLSAPPELGYYRRYVDVRRYPMVVPPATIDALYRVHPLMPVFVLDAGAAAPFLLVALVASPRRKPSGSAGTSGTRVRGSGR